MIIIVIKNVKHKKEVIISNEDDATALFSSLFRPTTARATLALIKEGGGGRAFEDCVGVSADEVASEQGLGA